MANILDYLDWRGDIPFSVSPFNDIDNLIFSQFSFIDLEGILPPRISGGSLALSETVERYFQMHPDDRESMGLIVPPTVRPLFRRMAECPRFRDLRVGGYVNTIDESVQKQFAAVTVQINEREIYVAYRGTDDTLVGWKENFNMSFMQAIPAQLDAVTYLNHVAADTTHPRIIIGGHSKGGNLAIYAAIHCEEAVKPRIVRVYSNDGPGYRREVVDSDAYRAIENRIVNIVPQTSVIGRLLEHDNRFSVIRSSATGLWQHDGFSWEVLGTAFVPADALTAESERIDRSLKKWVADMDDAKREKFVDSLYEVLTATNAKTLNELTSDRNWFWKMMTNSEISESRKTVIAGLTQLTGEAGRLWIESILPVFRSKKPTEPSANTEEERVSSLSGKEQKSEPIPPPTAQIKPTENSAEERKKTAKVCTRMKRNAVACKKGTAVSQKAACKRREEEKGPSSVLNTLQGILSPDKKTTARAPSTKSSSGVDPKQEQKKL